MRKYLFIFIGLMFTMKGYSQSYHPIPTDSVWWVEVHQGPYMGGTCIQSNYDYIYSAGDVTIHGSLYTEFRSRTVIKYDHFGPPPSSCPPNSDLVPDHTHAFIRNDSINKKVWLYDSVSTHADILLYDFDISLGDTVAPGNGHGFTCSSDTFTVVNVDSVDIGGEYRNRYEIYSPTVGWMPIYFIEGVGSNKGLAFNEYCPFEYTSNLICYHYKQFEYGDLGSFYCTTTLNVENNSQNPLSIFKPISGDQFEIMNPDNDEMKITCYDMLGKFILEKSFHEPAYLDLSEISSGVYVMYIESKGTNLKPYKFIITH